MGVHAIGRLSAVSHRRRQWTATRSFHLDNRNIDRRNDANTAEFTRTGHLILVGRFAILYAWSVQASHPCIIR
jgi:hypothetical protein